MATLLFRLNNVPEDEAEDVRQLLDERGLAFYETQAGFFGLGVAAIWLVNDDQLPIAKAILDEYQAKRAIEQREQYEQQLARGEIPGFFQSIWQHPIRFIGVLLLIAFVLSLMLIPFWKTLHP